MNTQYDKGAVLFQKTIPIKENETAESLEKKVKQIEKPFYFEAITRILKNENF